MHHDGTAYTAGFIVGTVVGLAAGLALVVVGARRLGNGVTGGARAGWIVAVVVGGLILLGGVSSLATHGH